MLDYWMGNRGCGPGQFFRHNVYMKWQIRERACAKKRRDFIVSRHNELHSGDWPFVHSVYPMDGLPVHREYHGSHQHVDPLIVSLLRKLNTIEGVQTFTSCQGTDLGAPYVYFLASLEGATAVTHMMNDWERKARNYWDRAFVSLDGVHEQTDNGIFPSWMLHFYDTLALVKFTRDYLGVPLADQLAIPKLALQEGKTVQDIKLAATLEEWEEALKEDT
jgi:hypothetical protein